MGLIVPLEFFYFGLEGRFSLICEQEVDILFPFLYVAPPSKEVFEFSFHLNTSISNSESY